jgi:hypothetical protein
MDQMECHMMVAGNLFEKSTQDPTFLKKIVTGDESWVYSQDLTPSDFWLFPTLKMGLKGRRFATMKDIKTNVMAELWMIPKEAFYWCFQQWQDRWSKCVCAQRPYFEGD